MPFGVMAAKKEHNRRFNNHKNGTNDDRACMLCHTQAGTFQDTNVLNATGSFVVNITKTVSGGNATWNVSLVN